MALNAPKQITWLVALVAIGVGIANFFGEWFDADVGYWMTAGGGLLLLLATYVRGL